MGFGFKNWKDEINVFCSDGDPKILIKAISKRICGISDTSSQAGSAGDVNTFWSHHSSSAALPALVPSQQEPNHGRAQLRASGYQNESQGMNPKGQKHTPVPCANLTA